MDYVKWIQEIRDAVRCWEAACVMRDAVFPASPATNTQRAAASPVRLQAAPAVKHRRHVSDVVQRIERAFALRIDSETSDVLQLHNPAVSWR
jgi:hypothetical protein